MSETTFEIGQKLPFNANGFMFLFNSGHPMFIVQDDLNRQEDQELIIETNLYHDGFLQLKEERSDHITRFDYRVEDFAGTPDLDEEALNAGLNCVVIMAKSDGTIYNICDSSLTPGLGKRVYGYYKKFRRGVDLPYFDVRDMIYIHRSTVPLAFAPT